MFGNAKWICTGKTELNSCPTFSKTFTVPKKIKKATLFATAIGIYNVYLNRKKISDRLFAPGWTSYCKRIQYQEYDLTESIKDGENVLELTCAPGWAVGYLGRGDTNHHYANHISVIANLKIEYEDLTSVEIVSDRFWEIYSSVIIGSEFYHGETLDLCAPEKRLGNAVEEKDPAGVLVPDEGEKICEHERISAKSFFITPRGERVIDFGQNLAGYVEIKLRGKRGDRIVLSHAEVLDADGNFFTKNLEMAKCRNTYIMSGENDILKPSFSFQGFRYVRLDEYPFEQVDLSAFTSVAVYSDMRRTGRFICGNADINRLYENTLWGQRSNFVDIPMDCPQRDERVGWTGDAQVFVRTAAINYDIEKFMKKWICDMALEQREDGAVGSVVPGIYNRGERISAAWGDAATICPWEIYLAYGDSEFLQKCLPMMERWVRYIHDYGENEYLWLGGNHWGDWLASDCELSLEEREGATSTDLIASAFYAYSVSILIKAFKALGKDPGEYEKLYSNIKLNFRKYFMEDGMPKLYMKYDGLSRAKKVRGVTQTAIVLILKFGLYEGEEERKKLTDELVHLISVNGGRMSTGFVGTPYILHVLSENGHSSLAYDLLLQEKSPSWLFSVKHGATTIWEHWDGIKEDGSFWNESKNSFNHYAYGSVFDWVYGYGLGIKICDDGAAYSKVDIRPEPDRRLGFARGSVQTKTGALMVSWFFEGDGVRYEMEIPEGTLARVILPDGTERECRQGKYIFFTKD